jgi:hypothetical protein
LSVFAHQIVWGSSMRLVLLHRAGSQAECNGWHARPAGKNRRLLLVVHSADFVCELASAPLFSTDGWLVEWSPAVSASNQAAHADGGAAHITCNSVMVLGASADIVALLCMHACMHMKQEAAST